MLYCKPATFHNSDYNLGKKCSWGCHLHIYAQRLKNLEKFLKEKLQIRELKYKCWLQFSKLYCPFEILLEVTSWEMSASSGYNH